MGWTRRIGRLEPPPLDPSTLLRVSGPATGDGFPIGGGNGGGRGLGGGGEREGNTALDWSCFDGAVMRDRCDLRYWLFFFLREIEIGPMIMITNINRIPKIDNDSVIKSAMELPSG